jgi:hypothetical protein
MRQKRNTKQNKVFLEHILVCGNGPWTVRESDIRSGICVERTDFTLSHKCSVTSFKQCGTVEVTENNIASRRHVEDDNGSNMWIR